MGLSLYERLLEDAEDDERNIILWMDHRATPQADAINAMGHERLSTVGGTISTTAVLATSASSAKYLALNS